MVGSVSDLQRGWRSYLEKLFFSALSGILKMPVVFYGTKKFLLFMEPGVILVSLEEHTTER
jgi:hypothetical protein